MNCDFGIRQTPGTVGVGTKVLEWGFCPGGFTKPNPSGCLSHQSTDPGAARQKLQLSSIQPHPLAATSKSVLSQQFTVPRGNEEGKPSSPVFTCPSSMQLLHPFSSCLDNFSERSSSEKGFGFTPGRVVC